MQLDYNYINYIDDLKSINFQSHNTIHIHNSLYIAIIDYPYPISISIMEWNGNTDWLCMLKDII